MRATVYGENEPCSRRAASSSDISVWKKLTKIHILSNLVLIILKLKQKKELACPIRFIIIIILQSLCLNFFPHLSQICRWLIVTFLWASVSVSFFLPPLLFPPTPTFLQGDLKNLLTWVIKVFGSQNWFAVANFRHLGCAPPVWPVKPSGHRQLVDPGQITQS